MLAVTSNVERMQRAQYCRSAFNALALDPERQNVAVFVKVHTAKIYELHRAFETLIEDAAELEDEYPPRWEEQLEFITMRCQDILEDFGLPQASNRVSLWRQAILVLDLAIVSYCGAHVERFDEAFLDEDLNRAKLTASWTYVVDGSDGIMLRRRSLRCLKGFLRSRLAWVFQRQSLWQDDDELYLSTRIEDLADIWGPVWSVKANEEAEEILQYKAGLGSIVPLTDSKTGPLTQDEVLCHWFAESDKIPEAPFSLVPDTKLLIGGNQIVEQKSVFPWSEANWRVDV